MTVGDVQAEQGRLMVPESYKGKKRTITYTRVQVGADTLAVLMPVIAGRLPSAPLLERWCHVQIQTVKRRNATDVWERHSRGAWTTASEMTRLWRQACIRGALNPHTIPYALRHSSIVRSLRLGLPIRLVAALHDTSVAMTMRAGSLMALTNWPPRLWCRLSRTLPDGSAHDRSSQAQLAARPVLAGIGMPSRRACVRSGP